MTDDWMNLTLITGILDVPDRHGYTRGGEEHTGRATGLISDPAHIYERSQHRPFGPYINQTPPSRTEVAPPEPASHDVVPIPPGQVKAFLSTLLIAAGDKCDRADMRADWTGHTCPARESCLRDAHDRLSAQLIQAAQAAAAATVSHPQPLPTAGREAGR